MHNLLEPLSESLIDDDQYCTFNRKKKEAGGNAIAGTGPLSVVNRCGGRPLR